MDRGLLWVFVETVWIVGREEERWHGDAELVGQVSLHLAWGPGGQLETGRTLGTEDIGGY